MEAQGELIEQLMTIAGSFGPYAPLPESDYKSSSKKMLAAINSVENEVKSWSSELHYCLAIAYRNYTAWYVRGDGRKNFLEKVAHNLESALLVDDNHINAKTELTRVLIEEKLIRNIEKALVLAKELQASQALPDWMISIIEKAKRWHGKMEMPCDCNFSKLDPTPAVLREERIKLRKILSELLKSNDEKLKIVALRLYNLALLVAYLYGSHDCNSGVMGMVYSKAAKSIKKIGNKFNYQFLGRIIDGNYLSDMDYRKLEKIFGQKNESLSVERIRGMV